MKKFVLCFLSLVFVFGFVMAQEWQVVKTGKDIELPDAGCFVSATTGFLVIDDGKVLKTTDGGATWTVIRESDGSGLYWKDIEFANENVGYACGSDGIIFKTTDGGATWAQVGDTANYKEDLCHLAVVNENVVYFAGKNATLLKTTDGGNSYIKSDYGFEGQDLDGGIAFCDENVGVVISDANGGYTFYTHDGGTTWNFVSVAPYFPVGTISSRLYDVAAAGDSTFFIAGYHYCGLLSTDGGKTYQMVTDFTYGYEQFRRVDMVDDQTIIVGGTGGHIVRSTDGGTTWDTLRTGSGQSVYILDFVDANTGYVFQGYGQWFKTVDGGDSFTPLNEWPAVSFWGLALPTDEKIVITGWGGGEMTISNDGGMTWEYPLNFKTGTAENLYECEFVDENTGMIAGGYGTMLKTNDGGNTWEPVPNPMKELTNKHYNALHYWNSDTLFAGGSSGYIFMSPDGGTTWKGDAYGSKTVYDLWPITGTKIIASESSGQIWLSKVEGDSIYFEMVDDYGSMSMRAVEFRGDVGIVVASKGYIYRTTISEVADTLYEVFVDPDGDDFYDVEFVNDTLVFVVGEKGKIYRSGDAGQTWVKMDCPVDVTLQKVRYRNFKLWAVGQYGTILMLDLSPQPISIAEAKVDEDNDFTSDKKGEVVAVQGVVTSINFVPGKAKYFFQDETGGICLFGNFALDLNVGDEIKVIGEIDQYKGLVEIVPKSVSDVVVLSTGNSVTPAKVSIADILNNGEALEGMLVQIDSVQLVNPSDWPAEGNNASVMITDGVNELKMFIDKDTDIDGSTPPSGLFKVMAVVDQFTSSTPPNDGYDLMPSFRDDIEDISAVAGKERLPEVFKVYQNYPNPFNPSTTIKFDLPEDTRVSVVIYNILGNRVRTLVDNKMYRAGYHSLVWDGKDDNGNKVTSGIYIYRVQAGSRVSTRRMLLIK